MEIEMEKGLVYKVQVRMPSNAMLASRRAACLRFWQKIKDALVEIPAAGVDDVSKVGVEPIYDSVDLVAGQLVIEIRIERADREAIPQSLFQKMVTTLGRAAREAFPHYAVHFPDKKLP